MNDKELNAINEYKKYVDENLKKNSIVLNEYAKKEKEAINELKEHTQKEKIKEHFTEVKSELVNDILDEIHKEDNNIIEKVLEKIPKPKDGIKGKDGIDGIQGKNGIKGKDGISLTFLGTFTQHPTKAKINDYYRNSITKNVFVYDGKKWNELIKDGQSGGMGGGLGVRDVRKEINERAKDAYFDTTGTTLSSTTLNSAIIEVDSATYPTITTITSADSPYTITSVDDIILGNNVTVILPLASSRTTKLNIKNDTSATNTITLSGNGVELVSLVNTYNIYELESFELISDLTQWWVL